MKKIYAFAFAALLAVGGLSLTSCGGKKLSADELIQKVEACTTLEECQEVGKKYKSDFDALSEEDQAKVNEACEKHLRSLN